jgi:hypothetical protein
MEKIKGLKAFEKGLICKGFQFAENSEFEINGDLKICENGFHFCENPLDVLNYYDLTSSEFAEVESIGEIQKEDDKTATSKIKIGFKLDLKEFIKASFDFLWEKFNGSQLAASGDGSQLAASGYGSKLAASGKKSVCANIGINGKIKASIGTWMTLAEYDENNACIMVKSAKIDGEILKADVWYHLINGEFVIIE